MTVYQNKLARCGSKREDGGVAYLVTNLVNGKAYVGITTEIGRRWRAHLSAALCGQGAALHAAIRKYGPEAFRCEVVACAAKWRDLCAVEMILIRQHDTSALTGHGYNLTLGGDGNVGHAWTEEAKAKLRASKALMSEETRAKMRAASLGRRHSAEARLAISEGHRRRKAAGLSRAPASDEQRRKLREAKLGRKRPDLAGKPRSEETRRKIAEANRGHTVSDETRRKISESKRGRCQRKARAADREAEGG